MAQTTPTPTTTPAPPRTTPTTTTVPTTTSGTMPYADADGRFDPGAAVAPGGVGPTSPGVMMTRAERIQMIREALATGRASFADYLNGGITYFNEDGAKQDLRFINPLLRRRPVQFAALPPGVMGPPTITNGGGDVRMTPREMLASLYRMTKDELTRVQMRMFEAGLYAEGVPTWGIPDAATGTAFQNLIGLSLEHPDKTVDQLLNEFAAANIDMMANSMDAERQAQLAKVEAKLSKTQLETRVSEETLSETIDTVSQSLLGQRLPDDMRRDLIDQLQASQSSGFAAQRQVAFDNLMAGYNAQDSVPGLDQFMAAISAQESGGGDDNPYDDRNPDSGAYGRYQIMPSNWSAWARAAGLPGDAPQTPENQERVARNQITTYYRMFGNWRDVAIAWYAGPGRVADVMTGTAGDGSEGKYPTINEYADQVMARMGAGGSDPDMIAAGLGVGDMNVVAIDSFDPTAEANALIKYANPTAWAGHEYANQASQFVQLLGSTVPGIGG